MIIETQHLRLRRLGPADAPFILYLLNDPGFLQYIGDKGVRTEDDARDYIARGPMKSYERFGFGLWLVSLISGEPIGMCGLLKRDTLEHADLGFALVPGVRRQGYAFESATAVLDQAQAAWGLTRVLAITSPDNTASLGLLEKLGFEFLRMEQLDPAEPAVKVLVREAPGRTS